MKEKIKVIIFVILLGMVSGSLILGVDRYTEPRVAKNQELRIKTAVLDVFGLTYNKDGAESVFAENVETKNLSEAVFYQSKTGEVAFEFSGSGLWGPISGIIALNSDLMTIKGLKIIHQEETPGLGGRIAEKEFLSQFPGKEILPNIKIMPPGRDRLKNEVDAISGATLSSKALEKLLNENIRKRLVLLKLED